MASNRSALKELDEEVFARDSGRSKFSSWEMDGVPVLRRSATGVQLTFRDRLGLMMATWKYETVSSGLILLNCITMGIEAHSHMTEGDVSPGLFAACGVAENVF